MVKNVLFLILLFFVTSCLYTRTSDGNIRFKKNRFTIKPNSNNEVYKLIDTTKLYELTDAINVKYNQSPSNLKKQFLKFYAEGRVGEFDFFYENDIKSLDPQKAKMAYYNYDGKDLIVQFYFESPQGQGLITKKVHLTEDNIIELISDEYVDKYKKINLPNKFLIYKPDW